MWRLVERIEHRCAGLAEMLDRVAGRLPAAPMTAQHLVLALCETDAALAEILKPVLPAIREAAGKSDDG